MGVWLLNITPVPIRQNQGFLLFLITQSGVKTIEYFYCTCRITAKPLLSPPPGGKALIFKDTGRRAAWGPHAVNSWYLEASMKHYRAQKYFIEYTCGIQVSSNAKLMPFQCRMPTLLEEYETVLAAATILHHVNYEFNQDEELKHKTFIQKLKYRIANKPPQRVATRSPQRMPIPSASVNVTAPEIIRNGQRIHQRRTQNNTQMPLIIKEVVDVEGIQFNFPPHQVDENSNEWRRNCLKRTSEIEAIEIATTNQQQKSAPQIIPNNQK